MFHGTISQCDLALDLTGHFGSPDRLTAWQNDGRHALYRAMGGEYVTGMQQSKHACPHALDYPFSENPHS